LLGVALDAAQIAQLRSAGALGVRAEEHDETNVAPVSTETLLAPAGEADPVPATWWAGAWSAALTHAPAAHAQALGELRERLADVASDWLVVGDEAEAPKASADSEEHHPADDGTHSHRHSDWIVDVGDEQASENRDGHKGLVDWSRTSSGSLLAARDLHAKRSRSR
jgi:hypothetical protein